jgi:hypothetical protein
VSFFVPIIGAHKVLPATVVSEFSQFVGGPEQNSSREKRLLLQERVRGVEAAYFASRLERFRAPAEPPWKHLSSESQAEDAAKKCAYSNNDWDVECAARGGPVKPKRAAKPLFIVLESLSLEQP